MVSFFIYPYLGRWIARIISYNNLAFSYLDFEYLKKFLRGQNVVKIVGMSHFSDDKI